MDTSNWTAPLHPYLSEQTYELLQEHAAVHN